MLAGAVEVLQEFIHRFSIVHPFWHYRKLLRIQDSVEVSCFLQAILPDRSEVVEGLHMKLGICIPTTEHMNVYTLC